MQLAASFTSVSAQDVISNKENGSCFFPEE